MATASSENFLLETFSKYFKNKKFAGKLLQKELQAINQIANNGKKPVLAILGGAKVSSKLNILYNLIKKVDKIIIGGGMAYTFIKNNGGRIGDSIFEADRIKDCGEILSKAKQKNVNVFLPEDVLCSNEFSDSGLQKVTDVYEISDGWQGLDIGPKTAYKFEQVIQGSSTILWNGPMGVFEKPSFEKGTKSVADAVVKATQNGAYSMIGGGDSVAAIKKFNIQDDVSFISTGGGAMLESLEGKTLPGINALLS
mgnify:CR=1 FL=1